MYEVYSIKNMHMTSK